MLYRDLSTQEEIDAEYNPLLTALDAPSIMKEWATESARVRRELDGRLGMRYGPTKDEYIDLFPATNRDAPLHIFIHGGYWRKGVAGDFSFIAPLLVESGVSVAILNYSLCPSVKLSEIVRQTRGAIHWLVSNQSTHGCNLDWLSISGHSAGGHLVAMALATKWAKHYGISEDLIKGGCAISGIFDLAPLPYSFLQPKLQLALGDIRALSPIYHLPKTGPELAVVVGGDETSEFIRQSKTYFDLWVGNGLVGQWREVPDVHHFSILNGFKDKNSDLFRSILSIVKPA
ncbi:MAG: esterase [Rhodospirillaceae bacterium]|nr:esterase [Rhodospirillaceae bacterium]|tara:strand:+ start:522 stop:1382 length:861 start_codon:yes stop_codon:yes gene_type:complete